MAAGRVHFLKVLRFSRRSRRFQFRSPGRKLSELALWISLPGNDILTTAWLNGALYHGVIITP